MKIYTEQSKFSSKSRININLGIQQQQQQQFQKSVDIVVGPLKLQIDQQNFYYIILGAVIFGFSPMLFFMINPQLQSMRSSEASINAPQNQQLRMGDRGFEQRLEQRFDFLCRLRDCLKAKSLTSQEAEEIEVINQNEWSKQSQDKDISMTTLPYRKSTHNNGDNNGVNLLYTHDFNGLPVLKQLTGNENQEPIFETSRKLGRRGTTNRRSNSLNLKNNINKVNQNSFQQTEIQKNPHIQQTVRSQSNNSQKSSNSMIGLGLQSQPSNSIYQSKGSNIKNTSLSSNALSSLDEQQDGGPQKMMQDIKNMVDDIKCKKLHLERLIGQGAHGVVYKGRWNQQEVAVKVIMFEGDKEVRRKNSAIVEAAISSSLSHPQILQSFAYSIERLRGEGVAHDLTGAMEVTGMDTTSSSVTVTGAEFGVYKLYLVQELCDKGNLTDFLRQGKFQNPQTQDLDFKLVCNILQQIAKGMRHLHINNIVHGDLKTNNILMKTYDSSIGMTAKVSDFGLSVRLQESQSFISGRFAGTPFYVAPEVVQQGRLSKRADVFSFGVIMWELYNQEMIYQLATYNSTKNSSIAIEPHLITNQTFPTFPVSCPLPFALLCALCLSPNYHDRPDFNIVSQIFDILAVEVDKENIYPGDHNKTLNESFISDDTPITIEQVLNFIRELCVSADDRRRSEKEASQQKAATQQVSHQSPPQESNFNQRQKAELQYQYEHFRQLSQQKELLKQQQQQLLQYQSQLQTHYEFSKKGPSTFKNQFQKDLIQQQLSLQQLIQQINQQIRQQQMVIMNNKAVNDFPDIQQNVFNTNNIDSLDLYNLQNTEKGIDYRSGSLTNTYSNPSNSKFQNSMIENGIVQEDQGSYHVTGAKTQVSMGKNNDLPSAHKITNSYQKLKPLQGDISVSYSNYNNSKQTPKQNKDQNLVQLSSPSGNNNYADIYLPDPPPFLNSIDQNLNSEKIAQIIRSGGISKSNNYGNQEAYLMQQNGRCLEKLAYKLPVSSSSMSQQDQLGLSNGNQMEQSLHQQYKQLQEHNRNLSGKPPIKQAQLNSSNNFEESLKGQPLSLVQLQTNASANSFGSRSNLNTLASRARQNPSISKLSNEYSNSKLDMSIQQNNNLMNFYWTNWVSLLSDDGKSLHSNDTINKNFYKVRGLNHIKSKNDMQDSGRQSEPTQKVMSTNILRKVN